MLKCSTFEMFRLNSYTNSITGLRYESTIFKLLKVVLVLSGGRYPAARLKSSLVLQSPPTRTNIPNPRRRVSHHERRFQPHAVPATPPSTQPHLQLRLSHPQSLLHLTGIPSPSLSQIRPPTAATAANLRDIADKLPSL